MQQEQLPLVGVVCDREMLGHHSFHVAGDKYLQALVSASNCLPVLIPALDNSLYVNQLLNTLDGLLLTGGYSMVNPLRYQKDVASRDIKLDDARDGISLPLAKAAVELGVPLLGICRGFQEINVAFGGSLHQCLHQNEQYNEHREDKALTLAQQYAGSHKVILEPKGALNSLLKEESIMVNSLHTQGVERLGDGLQVEALAEDGLIEAFSVKDASNFAMAVQWHPEWQVQSNKNSLKLFHAFGHACAKKQLTREIHG